MQSKQYLRSIKYCWNNNICALFLVENTHLFCVGNYSQIVHWNILLQC